MRSLPFRWGLRLAVGIPFAVAGAIKLKDPTAFAESLLTFQFFPIEIIPSIARWVPPLEIALGSALILGLGIRIAALGLAVLDIVFLIVLGQALVRGVNLDCGCFGREAPSMAGIWFGLGRDVLLLAGSAVLFRNGRPLPDPVATSGT